MNEKFTEQYNKVFNEDGSIKTCGRGECRKLISYAEKINNDIEYGDSETGFLNIENIKELYEEIINKDKNEEYNDR